MLNGCQIVYWYNFLLFWSMNASQDATRKKFEFAGEDLIHHLQLRNDEAFKYLHDAYSPALLASIKRIVKCMLTAEDILQNVFIKIWLHVNTYSSGRGCLYTWMLSIARHEAIDFLRSKQAKILGRTSGLHENEIEKSTYMQPELIRFDVLRSLALIPFKDRMVIELYNRGFTCREIGQLLDLPEGTVKTRMRISFRKLRAIHV